MTKLYTWNTPNGQKPLLLLEELGLDYEIIPVNIGQGVQMEEWFLQINPNGRIPALVDEVDGEELRIFESGAILVHLSERAGRFLPTRGQARVDALGWTFWQVGGLGPMLGQWGHFNMRSEKIPYAIERYRDESFRLFEVLERGLADGRDHLAGEYSIADMMNWTWIKGGFSFMEEAGETLPALPFTRAWLERVGERPAVKRAMEKAGALK